MPGKKHLFEVTYWLLKAATLLAFALVGLLALALTALLAFVAIVGVNHVELPMDLGGMNGGQLATVGAVALMAALLCVVMALFAIMLTTRIIETAISGNPFVNENAKRLMRIGWLLLGIEAIGFMINLMLAYLLPEKLVTSIDLEVSPVALLAILLIFVLAQIFHHGSEMRAELEATV